MTQLASAQQAYSQNRSATRSERGIEYEAFARATHGLGAAARSGSFASLAAAIHQNRRLWTLLARLVADPDNRLPEDLRARIFYLAEFTDHHSQNVLARRDGIDPLIEVNQSMMRGLQGGGA